MQQKKSAEILPIHIIYITFPLRVFGFLLFMDLGGDRIWLYLSLQI